MFQITRKLDRMNPIRDPSSRRDPYILSWLRHPDDDWKILMCKAHHGYHDLGSDDDGKIMSFKANHGLGTLTTTIGKSKANHGLGTLTRTTKKSWVPELIMA